MKEIALSQGKAALVDDADFEWLSQWKWRAIQPEKRIECWYAVRYEGARPKRETVYMHRQIVGAPVGAQVDHKSRDGLDNRRENLRIATRSQNMANQPISPKNTSGYKGVAMHHTGKWQAYIKVDQRIRWLGSFTDPRVAARAYDFAAMAHFGEFARLNFPRQGTETAQ
jgi:hypothetical protein